MQRTKKNFSLPLRALILVALLFCAVLLPWWLTGLLTMVAFFYYNAYELVMVGLLIDGVYGTPSAAPFGIEFFVTLCILAVALAAPLIKRSIIYYS